jgi:5'-nucleotidase
VKWTRYIDDMHPSPHRQSRRTLFALGIASAVTCAIAIQPTNAAVSSVVGPPVEVQLLAFNDFHGNLEPPAGSSGRIGTVNAGGFEYLATHLKRLREQSPRSITVSSGDLIGASPLLSALFDDEPTLEAAAAAGVSMNVVGNHEFDKGIQALRRIERGGCNPKAGCYAGSYGGSAFPFLAANVTDEKTGETVFPAYWVREIDGARIAFIGIVLKDTPTIVTPSGVAGLKFGDEVEAIDKATKELNSKGIKAIVVLAHQGGRPKAGGVNDCIDLNGPIVDIAKKASKDVDVFFTAHTHEGYNCVVDGRPVIQGASFGRIISKVDVMVETGRGGDIVSSKATNVIVTRDVPKAPEITAIIDKYKALSAPRANRVVGTIGATFDRVASPAGETTLGDLIADSQLAATKDPKLGGAVIALMNPGGIRTDLPADQVSGGEKAGEVTFAEAFAVQPFGNNLMTITLTGAQIKAVLEQQFDNPVATQNRILQVSTGFTYAYTPSAAAGSRVDPATIKLDGKVLDPATKYRVTVNNFLADGGDNFAELAKGTDRLGGVVDLDALEAYLLANPGVKVTPRDRIVIK